MIYGLRGDNNSSVGASELLSSLGKQRRLLMEIAVNTSWSRLVKIKLNIAPTANQTNLRI
jgi:hypothetical protein